MRPLGHSFQDLFEQTGMGIAECAEVLGIKPTTLRDWLKGKTNIPHNAYGEMVQILEDIEYWIRWISLSPAALPHINILKIALDRLKD